MIRFATRKDIPAIMSFIDKYWKKDHILSRDTALFEFQYIWGDETSFVVSEDSGEITGILGYIPYGESSRDAALAIWKNNKTGEPMQGIKMLEYLRENGEIDNVFAPGINPETIPIYKFLGIETGKMKHWYRLNPAAEYIIAKITDAKIPGYQSDETCECILIEDFEDAERFGLKECLSRLDQMNKSAEYVKRRYFSHPYFNYIMYGLKSGGKKLFTVLRIQEHSGARTLRFIDCLGDKELISSLTPRLDLLLKEESCEYADFYETGVPDEIFINGGWKNAEDTGNIIPEYFSPFEQRNIDIYYMNEKPNAVLFKGDGDMDRPN